MQKKRFLYVVAVLVLLAAALVAWNVPVSAEVGVGKQNFGWLLTKKFTLWYGGALFHSDLDMDSNKIDLDADADTSIEADTDDQIDVEISGADDFQFTANTFTAIAGSALKTNTINETTAASGVTVDGVLVKDGGVSTPGGAFTISDNVVVDGQADAVQLTVQGFATQTNNILVVETSAGADVFTVSNAGNVVVAGTFNSVGAVDLDSTLDAQGDVSDSAGVFTIADNAIVDGQADAVQLTVQGYTTQTGAIFTVETSAGADKFTVSNDGNVVVAGTFNAVGNADLDGTLNVDGAISDAGTAVTFADNVAVTGQADVVQLTVTAYATPTVQQFVVEQSGGADVFTVDANGNAVVAGTLNAVGAVDLDSTLNVDGAISDAGSAVTIADNAIVDGAADAIQLTIQGYTTQTNLSLVVEQSDGTDVFTVDNSGNVVVAGAMTVTGNTVFTGTVQLTGALDDDNGTVDIQDRVHITGQGDNVQLQVTSYMTQASDSIVVEDYLGADVWRVDSSGNAENFGTLDVTGDLSAASDVVTGLFGRFTAQASITVTDGVGFIPTGTYQPITAAGAVTPTITATVAGDIVILVNESAVDILLQDTGIQMFNTDRTLNQYDVLVMICDGTNWLELSFTDN